MNQNNKKKKKKKIHDDKKSSFKSKNKWKHTRNKP